MTDTAALVRAYHEYRKARMVCAFAKTEFQVCPPWRFIHRRRMLKYYLRMLVRQNELHLEYNMQLKGILPRAHPTRSRKTLVNPYRRVEH